MPELPEVETTKAGILPHLVGATIKNIVVRQPKLRWPVSDELKNMSGAVVESVERRAKYLLIETTRGQVIIHLGMSGALRILDASVSSEKHDHIDMLLNTGKMLRYTDPRRFGAWLWCEKGQTHKLLTHLGPEPLSDAFTTNYLYGIAKKRRVAIKSFIMDNKVVVGVGNIYAQEALFKAGIHPSRAAGNISYARYEKLVMAIREVLAAAIEAGGTTLKDFLKADGQPGYFQQKLWVYGRDGQACLKCQSMLKKTLHGQRSTVYCGQCQT